jgi:uncharacterized protein YjeT (DUF2065 family)
MEAVLFVAMIYLVFVVIGVGWVAITRLWQKSTSEKQRRKK